MINEVSVKFIINTNYSYQNIDKLMTCQFKKVFSVQFKDLKSKISFKIIEANRVINPYDGIKIETMFTNYIGKNLACKIKSNNKKH